MTEMLLSLVERWGMTLIGGLSFISIYWSLESRTIVKDKISTMIISFLIGMLIMFPTVIIAHILLNTLVIL